MKRWWIGGGPAGSRGARRIRSTINSVPRMVPALQQSVWTFIFPIPKHVQVRCNCCLRLWWSGQDRTAPRKRSGSARERCRSAAPCRRRVTQPPPRRLFGAPPPRRPTDAPTTTAAFAPPRAAARPPSAGRRRRCLAQMWSANGQPSRRGGCSADGRLGASEDGSSRAARRLVGPAPPRPASSNGLLSSRRRRRPQRA